jgi:putative ABC transport system substrate-binding protein
MNRRAFVTGLAAIFAAPLTAEAQQVGKIYSIGYLSAGTASDAGNTRYIEAFRRGLHELGWIEGQNITFDYRYADGQFDRLPALADELVRLNVDLIAASPTPAALAAKNATPTIPIVGMSLTEPVEVGLVATLARPGGNVTGVTYGVDAEIFGKQLALIKEAMPSVRRVAVLSNPSIPTQPAALKAVTTAARSLAVQLQPFAARAPGDFDPAFAAMGRERVGALVVVMDPMMFLHRSRLADAAMTHRLPSVSTQAPWAEAGGLLTYGPNLSDVYRRAATYVDKILKGAKPADLPVEQPAKFELVINFKTAKALGLTIPPSLLARADQVIE